MLEHTLTRVLRVTLLRRLEARNRSTSSVVIRFQHITISLSPASCIVLALARRWANVGDRCCEVAVKLPRRPSGAL